VQRVLGHRGVALATHSIPSSTAFVEASLQGLGWGMNPESLTLGHLRRGRLVDLVPGTFLDVPLYWQQWRLTSPTLGKFAAALKTGADAFLRPGSSARLSVE
jgi:LysR family transcriptional regulator (chromosome initiation inhibitor)